MIFKHIDVKPMTGALGAEIFGPNLAKPVPKAEFQEIYKAWLKYNVIFFRDQKITPNQQIVFAKKWGSIHIHPFIKPHPRYPEIIEIKKRETDTHTFGSSCTRTKCLHRAQQRPQCFTPKKYLIPAVTQCFPTSISLIEHFHPL